MVPLGAQSSRANTYIMERYISVSVQLLSTSRIVSEIKRDTGRKSLILTTPPLFGVPFGVT